MADALKRLGPLVQQAELLAAQYDAVVANPPYMGSEGMSALVKKFANDHFPDAKSDLFACFIEREYALREDHGRVGIVAPYSLDVLSSLRESSEKYRETSLRTLSTSITMHSTQRAFQIATFTDCLQVRNFSWDHSSDSPNLGVRHNQPENVEAIRNPRLRLDLLASQTSSRRFR